MIDKIPFHFLPLFGRRPFASLFESLLNGKFYQRHKIVCLRYIVTIGYCFLLALRPLFSFSPKRIDIFSFVDLLSGTIFSAARKSLTLWKSMTFSITWNLSGYFTHRYPRDSYPQTLEITLHWITAACFLENLIGLVSIDFEGFDFMATFHCN